MPSNDARVILAAANLRDLGGIRTTDGRRIRTGLLFRAGHLNDLGEADISTVTDLGLRTVIDLRRPSEIDARPHPDLDGTEIIHCQVSNDDNEFAVVANLLGNTSDQVDGPGMVEDYFRRNLTDRLDAYRPVFNLATDPARLPLLFNCTAGKDRTGFVAGILLRLLGVDPDTAIADYLLSNDLRRHWIAEREIQHRQVIAEKLEVDSTEVGDDHLAALRSLLWCQKPFLEAAFSTVTDTWGTWESFRRNGLGINDDRFMAFTQALLP
jgi:protein-tyrosine phosphatase